MQLELTTKNPSSRDKSKFRKDFVILALKKLDKGTSGQITMTTNDLISDYIESWSNTKHVLDPLLGEEHEIKKKNFLGNGQVTKRGVQYILVRLKKEGIVTKNENDVYRLTISGKKIPIQGELCGRMLLDGLLRSFPDSGDKRQIVNDLVKRLGVFMVFVMTRNLLYSENRLKKQLAKDVYEWLTQVINAEYLMDWFKDQFVKDNETTRSAFSQLSNILYDDGGLHDYYDSLMKAELDFGKEVFRPMIRNNYEQIAKRVGNN